MTIHCYRLSDTGHALRKAKLFSLHEDSMNKALIGLHPSAIDHELVIILYDGVSASEHVPTILASHVVPVVLLRCDNLPQILTRP